MSIKNWFVNGDGNEKTDVKDTTDLHLKFPSTNGPDTEVVSNSFNSFNTQASAPVFNSTNVTPDQEHLDNALKVYQNGFDSLAQPGYGFYQFYKAIMTAGADNTQVYPMAFMMGTSMDKNCTKDKLIQQSDFYVNKINEVYTNFINQGNSKKEDYLNQKANENQSLNGELELMHQQMDALKTQISDRENKLKLIDSKYSPMINEIDSKLAANDIAKNQVVGSINKVKQGIVNNLK